MPGNTPKQNATSAAPASAGGQSTASSPSTVLPITALSDALVNRGGYGDGTQTQVPPASQDAGAVAPSGGSPEPLVDGAGADGNDQLPEGQPDPNAEPTAVELTPEPSDIPPEPEGGETDPNEAIPLGVQRRFGELLAEIRSLKTQLANQRPADAAANGAPSLMPTGLEQISDLNTLAQREGAIQDVIDEASSWLSRLAYKPQEVEQYLRRLNVDLRDAQGNEEFSVETMGGFLNSIKDSHQRMLRHVPRRREQLQSQQAVHGDLAKVFPFLNDRTDPTYAAVHNLLARVPMLSSLPNPEYAALAYIEGDRSLRTKIAKLQKRSRPAANGNNGSARRAPGSGGNGAAPLRNGNAKTRLDAARLEVLQKGTQGALASFLETAGMFGR